MALGFLDSLGFLSTGIVPVGSLRMFDGIIMIRMRMNMQNCRHFSVCIPHMRMQEISSLSSSSSVHLKNYIRHHQQKCTSELMFGS